MGGAPGEENGRGEAPPRLIVCLCEEGGLLSGLLSGLLGKAGGERLGGSGAGRSDRMYRM